MEVRTVTMGGNVNIQVKNGWVIASTTANGNIRIKKPDQGDRRATPERHRKQGAGGTPAPSPLMPAVALALPSILWYNHCSGGVSASCP